jgi:hypothetical protein
MQVWTNGTNGMINWSKLDEVIQLRGVELGIKPLAIVNKDIMVQKGITTTLPYIEYTPNKQQRQRIYYQKRNEMKARQLSTLLHGKRRDTAYHIQVGQLLGYSNSEIQEYLARNKND